MNDILGNDICGSGFCSEHECHRTNRLLTGLDLQVLVNDIERIHLLTLIFMHPLGLQVKYGFGIQFHALMLFDIFDEFLLFGLLDLQKSCHELFIIGKLKKFLKLCGVPLISVSYLLGYKVGQFMIAG